MFHMQRGKVKNDAPEWKLTANMTKQSETLFLDVAL